MQILIKVTDRDIKKAFKEYYDRDPRKSEVKKIVTGIKELLNWESLSTIIHNAGID